MATTQASAQYFERKGFEDMILTRIQLENHAQSSRSRSGCILLQAILISSGLFSCLLLNGCTYYCLEGNGPRTYSQVAPLLEDLNSATLEKYRNKLSQKQPMSRVHAKGNGLLPGYELRSSGLPSRALFVFLGGSLHALFLATPPPEETPSKREILYVEKGWGVFGPVLSKTKHAAYDFESGKCLLQKKLITITGLMVFGREIIPENATFMGGPFRPTTLFDRVGPESYRYRKLSTCCLGLGLLAYGTNNGKRYFQILWIPIPLGTVKD